MMTTMPVKVRNSESSISTCAEHPWLYRLTNRCETVRVQATTAVSYEIAGYVVFVSVASRTRIASAACSRLFRGIDGSVESISPDRRNTRYTTGHSSESEFRP
jgi:hypothetical protein